MTRTEWRKRHEFAAYAEALDVGTDVIMSAYSDDDGQTWQILYTPDGCEDSDPVMMSRLWVDPQGVMEKVSTEQISTCGRWQREVETLLRKAREVTTDDEEEA